MPTQAINGGTIHYEEKGSGPLLVLLHAFPVDGRMWRAQLDELSSHHRVIAPDLRGFGKSTGGEPFTIPSMAEDIREFVLAITRATGACPESSPPNRAAESSAKTTGGPPMPPKFVLGGLSMGGYVAMNYARKYPEDLRGLILADTKDAGDTAEQRENRNRMIEVARAKGSSAIADMMIGKLLAPDAELHRPATAKAVRSMMESCPAKTIEHALAALRDRPDMTGELPKIDIPTLILVGELDAITPVNIAEGMQQRIAGSELAVIPGAGHMSTMEQPTLANRAIGKFLNGL